MAKKSRTANGKLAGKTVAIVGKFGYAGRDGEKLLSLVAAEGGSAVDGLQTAPDYLVVGAGIGGSPPAAVAKIQKKHPQVQLLDEAGFYQFVNPTAEEVREIISSESQGYEFWHALADQIQRAGQVLDLSDTDFRKKTINGTLYNVCLDDCDFRGSTISAYFGGVTGAKFDGATFTKCSFTNAKNCSLKNVTMDDVRWNPAVFDHCDFSDARLAIDCGSYTTANHCVFKKAELTNAHLDHSKFIRCDFSSANLTDAKLEASLFTGSNLNQANLTRADLRKANFANADLRKCVFKDALMSDADLSGAQIDGADFTGANLTDANLAGLDLSRAKNLVPKAARTAGPNLRQLAQVANASKRFLTSIIVELGPHESVTITPQLVHYGTSAYPGAGYSHMKPGNNVGANIDAPTFERGMLGLVDMWSRGAPQFDTIKIEAQKCPLRGNDLRTLVVAAWYEAYGLSVPTAEEVAERQRQVAGDTAALRETMLAELHGGAAGVKKWNERPAKEHEKLGKLRKHDFSDAKLARVELEYQNLEGSLFERADLKNANLSHVDIKGANFSQANMAGVHLAGSKSADASFEGAHLTECNLRAAGFRRCNFKNADLTNSDFSYSDLCGADLSGATLGGVAYQRTKFDEKTIFPEGYLPPEGLDWKGVGLRPGASPPPPPPKSGSLDLDTFLMQLNSKVELARMKKALSMLKAERFQLFADVKEDFLVGIVKSQSNKELVYSCRLGADGSFGCCTQNLRPCGGLRGALCKHLLVLILGLAKAGTLDSATVDHWIELSKIKEPAIDEDSMSATFLRYKGAEAGEVDWRPTETIPEDFYSM